MYKLVLKDSTIFDLKEIQDDEKRITIVLDTELLHDVVISSFTKENLSCVQVLLNDVVLNTYINLNVVEESNVKQLVCGMCNEYEITLKISKRDSNDIIAALREENEELKEELVNVNRQLKAKIKDSNSYIDELRDMVIAISMQ